MLAPILNDFKKGLSRENKLIVSKRSKKKESVGNKAVVPTPTIGPVTAFLREPVVHLLIIIVLGALIYSNTFNVPFTFDDEYVVTDNSQIKDLRNFINPLSGNRSLGFLTFALNYKIHALHVTGYHVVNLLIHLMNSLLVYLLTLFTFRTPYAPDRIKKPDTFRFSSAEGWLALFTTLLFASHPIQTQAVTYISQRFASLATLFYLFSLVMYIKARDFWSSGPVGYAFYVAAIFASVLAMRTKEIAFTLPVIVILYEVMFFKGDMKRRFLYLLPFLLTMSIIPLTMMGSQGPVADFSGIDQLTRSAGVESVSRGDYLNTQFRVIVTYIRLLFFPVNQNLDYDYPIYRSFFNPEVWVSFLFLFSFFALGVYLFYTSFRKDKGNVFWLRVVSFGIFWFFVSLSVESSIIPIADVIYEHRLYLPSVGFFMAFISFMAFMRARLADRARVFDQMFIPVLVIVVAGLSMAAYARNMVWRDEITLWEDVVRKSPNKVRAYHNLGLLYGHQSRKDRFDKAITLYQEAIKREPGFADAHNNLGLTYYDQGHFDDAIKEISTALTLRPSYADAHNNLGLVYSAQGRFDDAIKEYKTAIRYRPDFAKAHNNLSILYQKQNRLDEAFQEIQAALKYNPDYSEAHNNLGVLYLKQSRFDDAIKEIEKALTNKPDYVDAYYNLGTAYRKMGKFDEAYKQYQIVLRIDPANEDAYYNIGLLRQNIKDLNTAN